MSGETRGTGSLFDAPVWVILKDDGLTVTECYLGYTIHEPTAHARATEGGGTSYRTTRDGIRKIEAAVENERQMLESIRTGLNRRVRGVKPRTTQGGRR